jgi:hypothetical protein
LGRGGWDPSIGRGRSRTVDVAVVVVVVDEADDVVAESEIGPLIVSAQSPRSSSFRSLLSDVDAPGGGGGDAASRPPPRSFSTGTPSRPRSRRDDG